MTTAHLNTEFEQIRGQLKSFILRITACVADAEDIVQDTYLKAAEKIEGFRGESSLKTWLFTIASNLAKDNLRAKKTLDGRCDRHLQDGGNVQSAIFSGSHAHPRDFYSRRF